MTKPLTPSEADALLTPNPESWGPDGYPAGTLMGFPMIVRPDMPTDEVRFVQDDRTTGRIVNLDPNITD